MPEIGRAFCAGAHADEFDLGDEEAVAALVFAHVVVQVREVLEVVDLFDGVSVSHAGVPAVEGFDETDDAAATIACDGAVDVVLVAGNEVGAVALSLGAHLDVVVFSE